jgi:TRAP transporter 4TM/12TM fusion protein
MSGIARFRETVALWLGVCLTIFLIVAVITLHFQPMVQVGIFLAVSFSIVFMKKPVRGQGKDGPVCLAIDVFFALIMLASAFYIWNDYLALVYRAGAPTALDNVVNIMGTLLTLEVARRVVGWPMIYVCVFFILYAFFGQYLFPPLSHGGYDVVRVINMLFLSENGILGVPINVMFNFIYLFILFGALYGVMGGTEFFINLARSLFGRMTGGPAKVAVVSSGAMGTISGSAVANVVTTGTFTIPLMKKVGFEPHVAGAVEAVASTGGQLMPPIMGAAAFVMADYLNVPYLAVAKAAIIPGIVYYVAIFAIVHFYSLRIKETTVASLEETLTFKSIIKDVWLFLPPIFVLIFFLVRGDSPSQVILFSMAAIFIMSQLTKETRLGYSRIKKGFADAAFDSLTVTGACAAAGIVIGVVLLTGLGVKIGDFVFYFSGGRLWLALIFIMLASLVLGMGLPTLVCYLLLAVTTAPPLIKLGVPPMAAHLFIFYFGMLSMVTPPVAMAAYAGAALAKSEPMKTGFVAWKFALAAFFLPYMFVYNPSLLLMGDAGECILASATSIIGAVCLSAAIVGHLNRELTFFWRTVSFAAALLLIKPGWITDLIGICLALVMVAYQWQAGKREAALKILTPPPPSPSP